MAYQTGTSTSMNDLMNKLSTFAVANGWTQDQYTAEAGTTDGKMSLHKGTVYDVHFAWNSSESPSIAIYQSLGFIAAGTDLWDHTDDSGNGPASTPSTYSTWNSLYYNYRFISEIGSGPYTSYCFFQDNGPPDYLHVALEFAPYTYRHFGFGNLDKAWNWTGGEYCYGHIQRSSNPGGQDTLLPSVGSSSTTSADRHATIHAEGLPGEPASSKWGTFALLVALGSSWRDRAGEYQIRFVGGAPGGPIGSVFNNMPSNSGDGFLPLAANAIWYRDTTPSPDNIYFMGFQPDVRTLNMRNFQPQDEVTIGGDTWKIFPSVRKQNTGDKNESENLGIAYKKVP
jgi:hypothetical protein